MKFELQYKQYSERTILINWPSQVDEKILDDLLSFKKNIETNHGKSIVEVISSYNSLLVCYISAIENIYDSVLDLKSLYVTRSKSERLANRLWKIPVCYATSMAADLQQFSIEKSLTIDQVIALHSATIYTVYFIGFLPGFLYLGGLDDKLYLPRKSTPTLKVKKGSVAIGGNQTGIYPIDSPGGWHVIGSCPLSFFDPKFDTPCFAKPGDKIQFLSIDKNKYNDIGARVLEGAYELESILL